MFLELNILGTQFSMCLDYYCVLIIHSILLTCRILVNPCIIIYQTRGADITVNNANAEMKTHSQVRVNS